MNITEAIKDSISKHASDVHIAELKPYAHRIDGELHTLSGTENVVSADDITEFMREHFAPITDTIKSQDGAISIDNTRLRYNYYRTTSGKSIVLRILADRILTLEELGLENTIGRIASFKQGLVLMSGVTGSGKTTTAAAVLQKINESRHSHIITIENPIEYVFKDDKCRISQREVGKDTQTFTHAAVDAMREDPDIIFLGEMRDKTTIESCLTLAETGHLVIATIHCRNVAEAVDRIVDVYPSEQQMQARSQAINCLECVVSQALVPRATGGRYCLQEVMFVNDTIRNSLRERKAITTVRDSFSSSPGSLTVGDSAIRGIRDFNVSKEVMEDYLQGTGIDLGAFRVMCEKKLN